MSRESKRSSLLGTSLRISRAACFPMGRGVRVHAVVHRAGLWIVSRDEDNFYRVTGEEGGERINNENFSIVYVYKINHEEAKRDFCETGIVVFFTKDLYSITLVSFPPFFFLNYVKWKRENSPRKTTKFRPFVENSFLFTNAQGFCQFRAQHSTRIFSNDPLWAIHERENRFFLGRFVKVWPLSPYYALVR